MNDMISPVGSLTADQVRTVLAAATAAPSLHNSQPWRFRCTCSAIELYSDPTRALPAADPDGREMLLACGAALLNLRLAIRSIGRYADVRLCPDPRQPTLLAVVRPGGHSRITPADRRLAEAIARRRTNRKPFLDGEIPEPVRHQLRHAAELERSWLAIIPPHQLGDVQTLVREAHQIQQADPEFGAEWNRWTGRPAGYPDGVPSSSSGPLPEPQDEWVLRDFSAGHGRIRVPGKDFESWPLIAVIGSFHDLPLARLLAGQAMQRVLLAGTVAGLSASFLSQVIEVPTARRRLRELIGGGLWPQTMLRIGYGTSVPATPRRGIHDVLVGGGAINGRFSGNGLTGSSPRQVEPEPAR